MTKRDEEMLKAYLDKRHTDKYPALTVDAVVIKPSFDERKDGSYQQNNEFSFRLLLIKRGAWPEEGKWAIPGGFVKGRETCEHAVSRELKEDTNLDLRLLMPVGVFDESGRDIRQWIVSHAYVTVIRPCEGEQVQGGSDAAEAKWFRVVAPIIKNGKMILPFHDENGLSFSVVAEYESGEFGTSKVTKVASNDLAFDHGKIIATALLKLLSCDPMKLVPYFLPTEFTIPQFVEVYQYLTLKDIPVAELPNFRRALTQKKHPLLVETGKREVLPEGVGHPPARLYRLNA